MSEAAAAMGLTSLESADEFIAVNRRNYLAYGRGLDGVPGLELVPYAESEHNNYQYVVVEVDRERVVSIATRSSVCSGRKHRRPTLFLPRLPSYGALPSMSQYQDLALHATDALTSRVLCLPTERPWMSRQSK